MHVSFYFFVSMYACNEHFVSDSFVAIVVVNCKNSMESNQIGHFDGAKLCAKGKKKSREIFGSVSKLLSQELST